MIVSRAASLIALFLLFACAAPVDRHPPRKVIWQGRSVAVAPVIVFADQFDEPRTRFDRSALIGKIIFKGGYVTRAHEGSTRIESKEIQLSDSTALRTSHVRWLRAAVVDGLRAGGVRAGVAAGLKARVLSEPDYRKYPGEGRDNIHLPRARYALTDVRAPGRSDLVVIPVLLHAYQHTAGWFYDQTIGTHPGVRLGIMAVVYETSSGATVDTFFHSMRFDGGARYSMSTSDFQRAFESLRERLRTDLIDWLKNAPPGKN